MCVSILHRRHSIPLAWSCYSPGGLPKPQIELIKDILQQVHDVLGEDVEPVLILDRGLASTDIIDWCEEHHWHFLMRLQYQIKVCLKNPDGTYQKAVSAGSLAKVQGSKPVMGPAKIFKTEGYRQVNFVGGWPNYAKERWLLATDLPASTKLFKLYGRRMNAEHGFRDQKSHGLNWQESRIIDPAHASMLVLGMALALYFLYCLARRPEMCHHLRGQLERSNRRTLSVLQLGIRWLKHRLFMNQAQWPDPPPLEISVGR